jgi:hypothetical protein
VDTIHIYAYPNLGSGQQPIFLRAATYGAHARPPPGPPPTPNETCRIEFVRRAYPMGDLMAETMVPQFSFISATTNTADYVKGTAKTLVTKGAVVSVPAVIGYVYTTTGRNLRVYPGMATAAAAASNTGTIWTSCAKVAGQAVSVGLAFAGGFATGADVYSRVKCRSGK